MGALKLSNETKVSGTVKTVNVGIQVVSTLYTVHLLDLFCMSVQPVRIIKVLIDFINSGHHLF